MFDRPLPHLLAHDEPEDRDTEAVDRRRARDAEPRCFDVSQLPRFMRTRHRGLAALAWLGPTKGAR